MQGVNQDNLIVLLPFGSTLYGTEVTIDDLTEEEKKNTDEYLSDRDYKGIYLPSKSDILWNRVKKSLKFDSKENPNIKNTSDDIDCEIYSIHHFIKMALSGDTAAMDMLHCPENLIIESSPIWELMVKNRSKFYTKNLKSLVDYARGQAAKYGVKGSRIYDAEKVMEFFNQFDPDTNNPRLKEIWDRLPSGEHIYKLPPDPRTRLRMYQLCNRNMQETARVCYVRDEIVKRFLNDYGSRARMAAENKGIDWKAVSHAVRAGSQLRELLTTGNITFPLIEREFIKKVKLGRFSYLCMGLYLDNMVDELEELNKNSSYPMEPDGEYWENFLIEIIEEYAK